MKVKETVLFTMDKKETAEFYTNILGLRTIAEGDNHIEFEGNLIFADSDAWKAILGSHDITLGAHEALLCFEENNFDDFLERIKAYRLIYIHPEGYEGLRMVRFYDPDMHMIEVQEALNTK